MPGLSICPTNECAAEMWYSDDVHESVIFAKIAPSDITLVCPHCAGTCCIAMLGATSESFVGAGDDD